MVITVEDRCGPGQLQCRDGRCLPSNRFCDGRRDCSDGSDEESPFCLSRLSSAALHLNLTNSFFHQGPDYELTVTPEYIREAPWSPFTFACIAPNGQRPDIIFAADSRPIEQDPRFTVRRVNASTIEVTAPRGLRGDLDVVLLEYVTY